MKLIIRTILIPHIFQGNFRTSFQMHEHVGKHRDFISFYCLCMCFTLFLSSYLPQNKWPQHMATQLSVFTMWFSDFKITLIKNMPRVSQRFTTKTLWSKISLLGKGPSPQPCWYIKVLVPSFKIQMEFGGMGCKIHIQRNTAFYPINIIQGTGFTESSLL